MKEQTNQWLPIETTFTLRDGVLILFLLSQSLPIIVICNPEFSLWMQYKIFNIHDHDLIYTLFTIYPAYIPAYLLMKLYNSLPR